MRQMRDGGSIVTLDTPGRARAGVPLPQRAPAGRHLQQSRRTKTLATHPATTTHQRFTPEQRAELGIRDNTVRLSIGLEDPEDVMADLDQASQIRESQVAVAEALGAPDFHGLLPLPRPGGGWARKALLAR